MRQAPLLIREKGKIMTALNDLRHHVSVIASDVGQGFLQITHNSFAIVGLALAIFTTVLISRPELRVLGESQLVQWLIERQDEISSFVTEKSVIDRVTASDPKDLTKPQVAVVNWLSKKYGVAHEPLSALMEAAQELGKTSKLDPLLLMSVIAIESGFNPFAQSPVGAQGLMQTMTKIHSDKYDGFGGNYAAFDPVTNLRVGAKILKNCILKAGSVEEGLKFYVGAANLDYDGGYTSKVLAEYARLTAVFEGKTVAFNAFIDPPLPPI